MISDDELAGRLRAGDTTALRAAYDRYGAAVLYLAQRLLGDKDEAEDVTRATFVAAWEGRDGFDPQRGTMLAWLLGIARRKSADRCNSADRQRMEPGRTEPEQPTTGTAPIPEASPERITDCLVVADEMARLPDDQRHTLERVFFDDLSRPQIAASTGLPLDTVETHIRSGMASLRRRWEVDGATLGSRSDGPSRAL